jgi:4-amino-4-deoxy-L-arabinose transferase-like glycosyltransferase
VGHPAIVSKGKELAQNAKEHAGEGFSPTRPPASALPLLGVALLLALKLGVLALYGPTMTPDSGGYVSYADQILSGGFRHVDLVNQAVPITLARPIGYPAVIAAGKLIAGADWAWAIVLLQVALSLWATVMVYRLARMFELGLWIGLGVAAAQATAMQFVVDQAVLSDSLCASSMTIAACILAGVVLKREPQHWLALFGAGALMAVAFLMRDVIAFVAVGLVPLAAAAAMNDRTWLRRLVAFALVFIPLITAHRAYAEWNRWRVGAPVITTVSQWTLYDALGNASQFDPAIFSGPNSVDEVGRRVFKSFEVGPELSEAYEANEILHRDYGWSAVQIAHEVTHAYLRAWLYHPLAMIRHTWVPLSETQLHQAVRPTETIKDILLWNTGNDRNFGRERAVRNGNWWMIPAIIADHLAETASVLIFVSFIVIMPLRLARDCLSAEAVASAGLWCSYLVCGGLYAAVHLEPRYLVPVVAGSIIVGAANIVRFAALYRRRSAAKPARATVVGELSG